ncbi:hypothetical protein LJC63_05045, partial [Ruminococcaceae bacterium OttesenSCG-928-L11]|nr:hypothetical protein [Ruminococcaceae bacterium OttesenSCG-928-L11]
MPPDDSPVPTLKTEGLRGDEVRAKPQFPPVNRYNQAKKPASGLRPFCRNERAGGIREPKKGANLGYAHSQAGRHLDRF